MFQRHALGNFFLGATMKIIFMAAVAATVSIVGSAASAATVTTFTDGDGSGNDCSGDFGQGFDNCVINYNDGEGTVYSTPIIGKLGVGETKAQYNSLFPSLGDAEEELAHGDGTTTYMDDGFDYFTSTYTLGIDDPAMTLFVVKAGAGYTVYDSVYAAGDGFFTFDGSIYTMYYTETDMSHVSVYDSELPPPIPLPAAGWLLLGGLGGLAAMKRRKS